MCKKRTRAGKFFYFCIASLIFFSLLCCNALNEAKKAEIKQEEMRLKAISEHLMLANKLLEQGNYEASIEENQQVFDLSIIDMQLVNRDGISLMESFV